MEDKFKTRRFLLLISVFILVFYNLIVVSNNKAVQTNKNLTKHSELLAIDSIQDLKVQEARYSTEYKRDYFGKGWGTMNGCDTRNVILYRDLKNVVTDSECQVLSGELFDPYTGKSISFRRGKNTSSAVQIDHVVALSDAWIKGASDMTQELRIRFANDPIELLAVSGSSNQQKAGSDASEWLPENNSYRCEYVSRQIAIKLKYKLAISTKEKYSMQSILSQCEGQKLPAQ